MKNTFFLILSSLFFVIIAGCSRQTNPQFRIRNERTDKVNLNIQPSEGNRFSINEIEPGQTTSYQITSEGNITITDISHNESVSFFAVKNNHITILLSKNKPPLMQIEK